jgi:hypothetical protein
MKHPDHSTKVAIPLNEASLCQSCGSVVNSLVNCWMCDNGEHLLPLASVLDRTPESQPEASR